MEDLVGSTIERPLDQPKSILKKSTRLPTAAVPPNVNIAAPTEDQAARHLQTALSYAHQIRAQKVMQLEILEHIEALSLLPSATSIPSSDVHTFKSAVSLFQPSDYTALLEERNVNGLCGYTLCPNPPAPARKGLERLRSEASRLFCGNDCARKAMYVKAQLQETPAWERRGGLGAEIRLKGESAADDPDLPLRLKEHPPAEEAQLAHERGEQAGSRKVKLVSDDVMEKPTTGVTFEDYAPDSIEGYSIPSGRYSITKVHQSGK